MLLIALKSGRCFIYCKQTAGGGSTANTLHKEESYEKQYNDGAWGHCTVDFG